MGLGYALEAGSMDWHKHLSHNPFTPQLHPDFLLLTAQDPVTKYISVLFFSTKGQKLGMRWRLVREEIKKEDL